MADLDALAREPFGFSSLFPGQRQVMEHLLAGRSAAAIFPTGGGKSLCYQLPALALDGLTVVVSPLVALMKDQIDALAGKGITAHRLDSSLGHAEHREVMGDLRSGRARLLYVAPERFMNERFRGALAPLRIALFAVDEAHCISEWGHNFRPDYLRLAEIARSWQAERVLALTATAPPKVADDIARGFAIEPKCVVRTPFYRDNLELHLTPVSGADREALIAERLASRPRGPTLIYVSRQKTAEDIAERLERDGFPARAYHAGLAPEVRAEVQDAFLASDDGIVVATIAFGMGVDKADIRYVTHWNLPKSLESLAQEIGRAGRDGARSICEVLVCPDDLTVLENFAYGDTPTEASTRALMGELFAGDEALTLDLFQLSRRCDIRPLVLRTLLTYLELDGLLESGTPVYAGYRFKPLATSTQILAAVDESRRAFLRDLFQVATRKRTWIHIDAEDAARATASPRDQVVRALDRLAEEGHIELEPKGVRPRYRVLKRPDEPAEIARDLTARMFEREQREIARLGQVLELATQTRCQVGALGTYFGDPPIDRCGHCSVCLRGPATVPERAPVAIDERALADADALADDHPGALGDPRQRARFLCGLGSPGLSAAKLTRHRRFGALAEVPFARVLGALTGT